MRIALTKPLFAWDRLEDSPSLSTIQQLLATLPDGQLLQGLRDYRGRGRDDYPVSVLWGVVLLRILLRHVSFEAGTRYCYDRTSATPVKHQMSYIGYEPQRQTIKYRCPARPEGWSCPSEALCNAGKEYGKTVRVDCTIDLRRFPPIPRATKKFERLYRGRTSVERVNARLKIFWGVEDGNIRGARRFAGMVGAVMVVHLAFATVLAAAPRREGTLGKLRLGPIQEALQPLCRS